MKKLASFLFITILIQFSALAQPCLPNGITFSTQAEIDSFQVNYPGCNTIDGDVEINAYNIFNLNGLNILTEIRGDLNIHNNDVLADFTGLNNLTLVGGDLIIRLNQSLVSLTGLGNLTNIGGELWIEYNHALSYLTGLDNVTTVGDHLTIKYNDLFSSFSGLDNLITINGDLFVTHNNLLTDLTGLGNLDTIHGRLWLTYCYGLTSLSGLGNLESIGGVLKLKNNSLMVSVNGVNNLNSVGGGLEIRGNGNLSDLSGFSNLSYISGNVGIYSNYALTGLTGLDNINPDSINGLSITNNSALSFCDVQSICDYLDSPNGTIDIHDNAPGCNIWLEIYYACLATLPQTISGKVIYGDTLTPHQAINNALLILHNTNGITVDSTITDANGDYQFNNLSDGTYYIQTICTKAWGGGGASDAVAIMWHFVKLLTFTGINEKAGDVDGSGYLNSLDALYIAHRFVFMITSFPAGDWVFEEDIITVSGANVVQDIKGLCVGDVNASCVVPFN